MRKMQIGRRKLLLNRETLRRLDDELAGIQGGFTGTCVGSGCPECNTVRGSDCMTKVTCPKKEETTDDTTTTAV